MSWWSVIQAWSLLSFLVQGDVRGLLEEWRESEGEAFLYDGRDYQVSLYQRRCNTDSCESRFPVSSMLCVVARWLSSANLSAVGW